MDIISEELTEEIWQEVSAFSPMRGAKEMEKLGREQPELLAFMLEFSEDFPQDVKELAIYMFVVVYRMFRKPYGKTIKGLSAEQIMAAYEKNEDLILSLEGAHEKFYDRIAGIQISGQPYVMKYVVDTLVEMPDEDDPIDLTDDDIGMLFLILKTVADLLNEATER